MTTDTLDRLLTAFAIRLHAASVCEVQQGWRLAFAPLEVITVHHVLQGTGMVRVGTGPRIPYAADSVIVVPTRQTHVLGEAGPVAQVVQAEDHCSLLGDGLVRFTAGTGSPDTLLLCGAISPSYSGALGLFDLLREPLVEDFSASSFVRTTFEHMLAEVANPGLGTRAMTEALMKQCLVVLLRRHLLRESASPLVATAVHHPRLARAVLAVLEAPAAPHTVETLALSAGMSRASFAEHFSRTFEQGPIDFVQKVRLRIAARLLATTDFPLKVIAQSVGYAGPAPFSRAFRNVYGADPTAYRALGRYDERETERCDLPLQRGANMTSINGPESTQEEPGGI